MGPLLHSKGPANRGGEQGVKVSEVVGLVGHRLGGMRSGLGCMRCSTSGMSDG